MVDTASLSGRGLRLPIHVLANAASRTPPWICLQLVRRSKPEMLCSLHAEAQRGRCLPFNTSSTLLMVA